MRRHLTKPGGLALGLKVVDCLLPYSTHPLPSNNALAAVEKRTTMNNGDGGLHLQHCSPYVGVI